MSQSPSCCKSKLEIPDHQRASEDKSRLTRTWKTILLLACAVNKAPYSNSSMADYSRRESSSQFRTHRDLSLYSRLVRAGTSRLHSPSRTVHFRGVTRGSRGRQRFSVSWLTRCMFILMLLLKAASTSPSLSHHVSLAFIITPLIDWYCGSNKSLSV